MSKRAGLAVVVVAFMMVFMFLAPRRLASADQDAQPDFGPIVIARDVTDFGGYPIDILDVYPSGIKKLVAVFEVKNAPTGSQIESQWYRNGQPASNPSLFVLETSLPVVVVLRDAVGLPAGDWELRVRYQGKTVNTAKLKIANKMVIFPLKFGEDFTLVNHELLSPQTEFASGSRTIAAVFYYANLPVGAKVEAQWIVNGETLVTQNPQMEGSSGTGATGIYNVKGLAAGTYELRILVNGKVEQFAQVMVKATR
jgi:hypothetical protein